LCLGFRDLGLGFRVFGFWVLGLRFAVGGLGLVAWVKGEGFQVLGFRV